MLKFGAASGMVLTVVLSLLAMLAAMDASNEKSKECTNQKSAMAKRVIGELPQLEAQNEKGVTVFVVADGERRAVWLPDGTVKDAIEAGGITLAPHDRVKPPLNVKLKDGMSIVVERVRITEERQWEFIQPTTLFQFDSSLPSGRTRIVSPGEVGLAEVVTRVYRKDGKVTLRQVLLRNVVKEPKPAIIGVGIKQTPTRIAYRGALPSRGLPIGIRVMTMIATAYHPGPRDCGKYADGLTATGIRARRGVVAVDPRVIRLGTRLYVEGYGYAIAADTGGAIKGNRIDLCFDTYEEAVRWGIRPVRVLILSLPDGTDANEWLKKQYEK